MTFEESIRYLTSTTCRHIGITMNPHVMGCKTVKEAIDQGLYAPMLFLNEQAMQRCIEDDCIWILSWCVDDGVAMCSMAAPTMQELMDEVARHTINKEVSRG